MTKEATPRDFDAEIAAMAALATAVADRATPAQFAYPVPALRETPGIVVVSTTQQGEVDANEREDRR